MDFVTRLKQYIEYTGLPFSQFADTAQIPRPTLSQILNGRNKKISNELIAKLHEGFPKLNVIWMLFGEGTMENPESGDALIRSGYDAPRPQQSSSGGSLFGEDKVADFEDQFVYCSSAAGTSGGASDGRNSGAQGGGSYSSDSSYDGRSGRFSTGQRQAQGQAGRSAEPSAVDDARDRQRFDLNPAMSLNPDNTKRVQSIMVFYSDNSFEIFTPSGSK